jgi:hypothetical protein
MRRGELCFGRAVVVAAFACFLCFVAVWGAERDASFTAALESINVGELKGHVDYLADDALEGREAGKQGGREAGDYLGERLTELGMRGAGVDGGFFQPFGTDFRNVLAIVEGGDPDLSGEYVVVGAHYDHLGYGTKKTSRGPVGQIHNGADDNASGTSALLELAEAVTMLPHPPRRSIVLAFWDAEEKGMLGSKHWASQPLPPTERVVALVNVDMVGRLRDERLNVFGTRSGYGWRRLVSGSNEDADLKLDFNWDMKRNGDHWPFFDRSIPSLMLHTGVHEEYHRPSDDAHTINAEGMRRAARLLFALVYDLGNADKIPAFRPAATEEKESTRRVLADHEPEFPERLGVHFEAEQPPGPGVYIIRVTAGSAADSAGLRAGDRVIECSGRPIGTGDELRWAVTSASNPVSIVVRRSDDQPRVELTGHLPGNPMRLGITWSVDDAEPGTVILNRVVAGSPAAEAGLEPGDHVYQIAGRDFSDESEFAELAKTLAAPVKLLVERDGRLRTVEIRLDSGRLERAA